MNLEIKTPEAARDLAKALRKFCEERASLKLPVGHSLEVVAGLLGQPNWDTLSGLLKSAVSQTDVSGVPSCLVYFDAFADSEWGETPAWAKLELTPQFVARVRAMQKLATERYLSEVREWDEPDWAESNVRLLETELVVLPNGYFWYRADVKHVDYSVETQGVQLDDLLEKARTAVASGKTYVVHSPNHDLEPMLREAGELDDDQGDKQD